MAEKLRAALKQDRVRGLPVTVCMGVAQWRRGEDAAALLARADRALYRAKACGRDRVACDSAEPPGRARLAAGPRRAAGP
jgi:PleD family two-component response regulator